MQDGIVVYEIPIISEWVIFTIGFSIAVIVLLINAINSIRKRKWLGIVGYSVMFIIFSCALYIIIDSEICTYNETYKVYQTGGYNTVNGQIEKMEIDEEEAETRFTVGDVDFVLTDDMAGFSQRNLRRNQKRNNSSTLKSGNLVTIEYVSSEFEFERVGLRYIILYIEKHESH